jgi:hypothetical protein
MMGVTVNAKKPLWCEKTWYFQPDGSVEGWLTGDIEGYFVCNVVDEKIVSQTMHQWGPWWIYEDNTKTKVLLGGSYKVLITPKNGVYRVGGPIEWVDPEYADLLGRKWWAIGDFIIDEATGQPIGGIDRFFRVN